MPRIVRRRITEEWTEEAAPGETLDGDGYVEDDEAAPEDEEPAAEEKTSRRRRASR